MNSTVIDSILLPKSIAVIGASATPGKIGYTVLNNLVNQGYKGEIYPINPKGGEILGRKVYTSVMDVPGTIDSAVITVPASITLEAVEECGKKGIKGLIIITSGFSEVGKKDLEEKIVATANSYGSRVLGPNIVGVLVQLCWIECFLRSVLAPGWKILPHLSIGRIAHRHRCRHLHPPGRFRQTDFDRQYVRHRLRRYY